jgi:hypothetical protein
LSEAEHVSVTGGYQTSFLIPIPPAPAAPALSLNYDSHANGTLAGKGWDLSIGYPLSIMRDVRFGTPEWTLDANWMWGNTPLVRMKAANCSQTCDYRTAPDSLTQLNIDLSRPTNNDGQPIEPAHESATVHLPNGTTLHYEPIYYDGSNTPSPPAGAQTWVFGFRLTSVFGGLSNIKSSFLLPWASPPDKTTS